MEVDGDVDGKLAQQFGCMGTVDREVLVRQFQQILGPNHPLPAESCAFFLDMNNWNLQAALGSYYDFGNTNGDSGLPQHFFNLLPNMVFVKDITIGEGESVPPSTGFVKTWRLRNPGPDCWPEGCSLKHIEGQLLSNSDSVQVPALPAGQEIDLSAQMFSPQQKGIYQSRWQLVTSLGVPFGEMIWCIIIVEDSGLLGITQQFATTSCGTLMDESRPQMTNPFGQMNKTQEEMAVIYDQRKQANINSIADDNVNPVMNSILTSTPPRADCFLINATTPTSHCSSVSVMDASLMAVRGSPTPQCLSLGDVDPPSSPNGSTALYEAVAAALPQQWIQRPDSNISCPLDIPSSSSEGMCRRSTPEVPPCTPCTPPGVSLLADHQGNLRLCAQSPSISDQTDMQQL